MLRARLAISYRTGRAASWIRKATWSSRPGNSNPTSSLRTLPRGLRRLPNAIATLSLAVAAGAGCAGNSQTREARIPGERQDCQAAAARVTSNSATAETFKTLAWCDETGPAALAGVWRVLPADTVKLRAFFFASSHVRDARISRRHRRRPRIPRVARGSALPRFSCSSRRSIPRRR